mmetsp:Transcript_2535/g.3803  ORF Transcript_2535/g.3803 Transcript_2535/m.3803 type:complete len:240 (-) Transcript_2535:184-903(-)
MLLVGIGSAIAQQIVGIDAIQYFLTFIIERAGIEARSTQSLVLIGLGLVKVSVIVIAGNLFDTRGRRPLILRSLLGMSAGLFLAALSYVIDVGSTVLAILAIALYLGFFSYGMGPGAWLIPAEVFSTTIRAKAMSVATFLNRLTATVVTSTFLTLANSITWQGFFSLYGVICLLVMLFFYNFLPETKGKSLEDMSLYFAEITGDMSVLEAEKRLHGNATIPGRSSTQDGRNLPTNGILA